MLIWNWKTVLKKAWSLRLALVAGLFSAAEAILPLFMADLPRGLFAVLSAITIVASAVSRLVAQKDMMKL